MSHLHLPDGLVPVWLWASALVLVVALLALTGRSEPPLRVAYRGALGGLMLAAMAIPLGPLDYHLSLAGPVGVLLGAAGAFQVAFVVSAILAFVGHGGVTVIGLNTLVLGTAAAFASLGFRMLAGRLGPAWGLALATAAGQLAGALWTVVVLWTLRSDPGRAATLVHGAPRFELLAAVTVSLWIAGALAEAVVAFGIGRFLTRVYPGLLPVEPAEAAEEAAATPGVGA